MTRHKTARGREFNMNAFASNYGDTVAVGNSGRNARGDLLGPGGTVIATKNQIATVVQDKQGKPKSKTVKLNPLEQEISRREVVGADGIGRIEITYADGSVEVIGKPQADIQPNQGDI